MIFIIHLAQLITVNYLGSLPFESLFVNVIVFGC